jgi:CPA2 family monovalent cation:H+ antiporter-2
VLANIRSHAPHVPGIVRTVDDHDLEKLQQAGATEVVPEAIEGSLMLASHALALVGVPMRRVIRVVQDQRDARYNLLRGYFHGSDDDTAHEIDQTRLSTVTLGANHHAVGHTFASLHLPHQEVQLLSLRRSNGVLVAMGETLMLALGDTLVLSGKPEALAVAEQKLVRG